MMILTAKVDLKKIMLVLAGVAAAVLVLILLLGRSDSAQTSALTGSNDSRVQFLQGFGWEVKSSPKESGQVRIPEKSGEVFERYNTLQKSQGYDLSDYAGKKVMRYVYEITNYPGASEPVYATVLMYKNRVIGGDITNTAPGGKIHGFGMPQSIRPTQPAQPSQPISETLPDQTAPMVPSEDSQG